MEDDSHTTSRPCCLVMGEFHHFECPVVFLIREADTKKRIGKVQGNFTSTTNRPKDSNCKTLRSFHRINLTS